MITIRPARTIGQSFSAVAISFSLHVSVSKKERGTILMESYDGSSHIPKHPSCFQYLPSAKSFAELSLDYFWNGHVKRGGKGKYLFNVDTMRGETRQIGELLSQATTRFSHPKAPNFYFAKEY